MWEIVSVGHEQENTGKADQSLAVKSTIISPFPTTARNSNWHHLLTVVLKQDKSSLGWNVFGDSKRAAASVMACYDARTNVSLTATSSYTPSF